MVLPSAVGHRPPHVPGIPPGPHSAPPAIPPRIFGTLRAMSSRWSQFSYWLVTTLSLAALACIAGFLVLNVEWFKAHALPPDSQAFDPRYQIYMSHIFLSMIKRSVALFAGFFLMFIGSSILLFVSKNQHEIQVENGLLKASLISASPGMVALLCGLVLLMHATASKDSFPDYVPAVVEGRAAEPATPEPLRIPPVP